MSITIKKTKKIINDIQKTQTIAEIGKRILPKDKKNIVPVEPIPYKNPYSKDGQEKRLSYLKKQKEISLEYVSGKLNFDKHEDLKGNIENFIGMAQIPIGIAGPLMMNGTQANGDFFIPLATTEGALVASYSRGMKACRESGGISAVCTTEGVQRSPFFKLNNIVEVGLFVEWAVQNTEIFAEICRKVSRYAELQEMMTNIEGNSVILSFEFTTGDAAGQNMVTLCTNEICKYIIDKSPVKPKIFFIESNYSGDKKATALSFSTY